MLASTAGRVPWRASWVTLEATGIVTGSMSTYMSDNLRRYNGRIKSFGQRSFTVPQGGQGTRTLHCISTDFREADRDETSRLIPGLCRQHCKAEVSYQLDLPDPTCRFHPDSSNRRDTTQPDKAIQAKNTQTLRGILPGAAIPNRDKCGRWDIQYNCSFPPMDCTFRDNIQSDPCYQPQDNSAHEDI